MGHNNVLSHTRTTCSECLLDILISGAVAPHFFFWWITIFPRWWVCRIGTCTLFKGFRTIFSPGVERFVTISTWTTLSVRLAPHLSLTPRCCCRRRPSFCPPSLHRWSSFWPPMPVRKQFRKKCNFPKNYSQNENTFVGNHCLIPKIRGLHDYDVITFRLV